MLFLIPESHWLPIISSAKHRLLLRLLAMSFVLLAGPGVDSIEVNTRIPLHLQEACLHA